MRNAAATISLRDPGALDLVQSLLEQGIAVRIRVSGSSMKPLLKDDDAVEVVPFGARPLLPGDILLLRGKHNTPLVHRLIWRRRRGGVLYLITQGDACAGLDRFIPAQDALGRVERILPNSGEGRLRPLLSLGTPRLRLWALYRVGQALLRHLLRRICR